MATDIEVKERPILFSTPMVRAILEGRKTVTRRIIKESFNGCLTNGGPHPCPNDPVVIYPGEVLESPCHPGEKITVDCPQVRAIFHCSTLDAVAKCPYGKPGDALWVRETWTNAWLGARMRGSGDYVYKADIDLIGCEVSSWKPSIFMPRAACRLRLQIQSIGVERLQDITEEDAFREGIDADNEDYEEAEHYQLGGSPIQGGSPARFAFIALWQRINGAESWDANPWVWRIQFKKLTERAHEANRTEVTAKDTDEL
jgi:hypothetical protein